MMKKFIKKIGKAYMEGLTAIGQSIYREGCVRIYM